MANFPSRTNGGSGDLIKPSSRSFTIGDYPSKTYRSLSGAIVKRSFGNKSFGYKLELTFENVSQPVVAAIFDHYHGQYGTTEGFLIPDSLFSGYDVDQDFLPNNGNYDNRIITRMNRNSGILWFYEQAPQVESVSIALSTISISLAGERSS